MCFEAELEKSDLLGLRPQETRTGSEHRVSSGVGWRVEKVVGEKEKWHDLP